MDPRKYVLAQYFFFAQYTKMLIHVAGPSGSGKSYIGAQLSKKFGNKIKVFDLDDFQNLKTSIAHIEKTLKSQIVVLVGHNFDKRDNFLPISANYKFYLDYDAEKIMKQRFFRDIQYLNNDPEQAYRLFSHGTIFDFDKRKWLDSIAKSKQLYKKAGYIFGTF